MSMLDAKAELQVKQFAAQHHLSPQEAIEAMIEAASLQQGLLSASQPGALAALMEEWRAEDAAMTEEEAEQAEKDLADFKANMNANRRAAGERLIYP